MMRCFPTRVTLNSWLQKMAYRLITNARKWWIETVAVACNPQYLNQTEIGYIRSIIMS